MNCGLDQMVEEKITITVSGPNPIGEYIAWVGDYDLDITTGNGSTRYEAIRDLMDRLEDAEITMQMNTDGALK